MFRSSCPSNELDRYVPVEVVCWNFFWHSRFWKLRNSTLLCFTLLFYSRLISVIIVLWSLVLIITPFLVLVIRVRTKFFSSSTTTDFTSFPISLDKRTRSRELCSVLIVVTRFLVIVPLQSTWPLHSVRPCLGIMDSSNLCAFVGEKSQIVQKSTFDDCKVFLFKYFEDQV